MKTAIRRYVKLMAPDGRRTGTGDKLEMQGRRGFVPRRSERMVRKEKAERK